MKFYIKFIIFLRDLWPLLKTRRKFTYYELYGIYLNGVISQLYLIIFVQDL